MRSSMTVGMMRAFGSSSLVPVTRLACHAWGKAQGRYGLSRRSIISRAAEGLVAAM